MLALKNQCSLDEKHPVLRVGDAGGGIALTQRRSPQRKVALIFSGVMGPVLLGGLAKSSRRKALCRAARLKGAPLGPGKRSRDWQSPPCPGIKAPVLLPPHEFLFLCSQLRSALPGRSKLKERSGTCYPKVRLIFYNKSNIHVLCKYIESFPTTQQ
jgi:hypothetical protein